MAKFDFKNGTVYTIRSKKWTIVESYRIDWEDRSTSYEYKLKSENNKAVKYLERYVEGASEKYSLWTAQTFPKNLLKADDFVENIEFNGINYPKKIVYKGTNFTFLEASNGVYSDSTDTENMYAVTYADSLKAKYLSIEFYEDETELSIGESINVSNIQYLKNEKPSFFNSSFFLTIKRNLSLIGFSFFILFIIIASTCDDDEKTERNSNGIYRHRSTGSGGK